jgi:hypothetical protein
MNIRVLGPIIESGLHLCGRSVVKECFLHRELISIIVREVLGGVLLALHIMNFKEMHILVTSNSRAADYRHLGYYGVFINQLLGSLKYGSHQVFGLFNVLHK